jgi:hypothetical protein
MSKIAHPMKLLAILTALLLSCLATFAQDAGGTAAPQATSFKVSALSLFKANDPTPSHPFWDKQNKIAFAVTAGIRTADIAQTCYGLAHGARELALPTQSCAGVASFIALGQGEQLFGQWIAHRKGWHRLERIIPYVSAAPNAFGIAYSLRY